MIVIFLIVFFLILSKKKTSQEILKDINSYFLTSNTNFFLFTKIITQGSNDRYFSIPEFFDIINSLSKMYPQHITGLNPIGSTFQKNEIKAFRMGRLEEKKRSSDQKGYILITGCHGAKEPLTLQIIFAVFLNQMRFLIQSEKKRNQNLSFQIKREKKVEKLYKNFQKKDKSFKENEKFSEVDIFDFCDFVFVPVINVDGFIKFSSQSRKKNKNRFFGLKNLNNQKKCELNNQKRFFKKWSKFKSEL